MSLFTPLSLWTMLHGVVLGGSALLAMAAALFFLTFVPSGEGRAVSPGQARALSWLLVFGAATLWLTVIVGTFVIFPPYRTAPPAELADLGHYPRSLLLASPETAWLHTFAMEAKEHLPWASAMLATAVAFVGVRSRSALLDDPWIRGMATALLAISLALVMAVALLGVFVNKVAPLG